MAIFPIPGIHYRSAPNSRSNQNLFGKRSIAVDMITGRPQCCDHLGPMSCGSICALVWSVCESTHQLAWHSLTMYREIGTVHHHPPQARRLMHMLPASWAQIKPQGAGPKWLQHCGPPMTISVAIGDKESWLDQWLVWLKRRPQTR